MAHTKPQVIIDLDEYNELKNFKAISMSETDAAELKVLRRFAHVIQQIAPSTTLDAISARMHGFGIDFKLLPPSATGEFFTKVSFTIHNKPTA